MLGLVSDLGHAQLGGQSSHHFFLELSFELHVTSWHTYFCFALAVKNIETFRPIDCAEALFLCENVWLSMLFYFTMPHQTLMTKLQSRTKVVGTVELDHESSIPPNQCWKISRFFQQKEKKTPDYQHCKWGQGRACSLSQPFCLGLQLHMLHCLRNCVYSVSQRQILVSATTFHQTNRPF